MPAEQSVGTGVRTHTPGSALSNRVVTIRRGYTSGEWGGASTVWDGNLEQCQCGRIQSSRHKEKSHIINTFIYIYIICFFPYDGYYV